MQNQYPDMLRFTQIGTIVIDLVFYHIFHNFQSDDRLRGRSLLRSRNLLLPQRIWERLNSLNVASKGMLNTLIIMLPSIIDE